METTLADELSTFVRTAKTRGVPDDALVAVLKHAGWSERRIYRGLGAYYTETLGVTVPRQAGTGDDARQAFLYLLNFITLAFWTTSLGFIFYILIDRTFPDAAALGGYTPRLIDQLAWPLATLLISFPAFGLVAREIGKLLRSRPDAALSGVRAWLTYIALVIAAIIVLQDGIWFLWAFLRGALTVRFVLDSLVLLVLSGGVFVTYLRSLRARTALS